MLTISLEQYKRDENGLEIKSASSYTNINSVKIDMEPITKDIYMIDITVHIDRKTEPEILTISNLTIDKARILFNTLVGYAINFPSSHKDEWGSIRYRDISIVDITNECVQATIRYIDAKQENHMETSKITRINHEDMTDYDMDKEHGTAKLEELVLSSDTDKIVIDAKDIKTGSTIESFKDRISGADIIEFSGIVILPIRELFKSYDESDLKNIVLSHNEKLDISDYKFTIEILFSVNVRDRIVRRDDIYFRSIINDNNLVLNPLESINKYIYKTAERQLNKFKISEYLISGYNYNTGKFNITSKERIKE